MALRMPAQWTRHERTMLGWPCREAMWKHQLPGARQEMADTANAIAAFEPVTMVCTNEEQAAQARSMLASNVDVVVIPMDGSWLRDNGPIYVTDGVVREARHFRFNGYGEYQAVRERDARLGATLARELGDGVLEVDLYLEGGAICTDGEGTVVVTQYCLLNPNRNWHLTQDQVEQRLQASLGMDRVVWLPLGRVQDRGPHHTDGHTDLFLQFVDARTALLMAPTGPDDVNHDLLLENKSILQSAGYTVIDLPLLPEFEFEGQQIIAPHMNFYICNGGVIVPVSGADPEVDSEALRLIGEAYPRHEVVPVMTRDHFTMGGAVHCITQQVPAIGASA